MVEWRRPADVVVLAAGRSSRMGEPKGLVLYEGRPWLEAQLSALLEASRRVVIVLGHDHARYLEAIPDLAKRVEVVVNPDPERGPFSSLQAGVTRLAGLAAPGAPPRPAFVLPIDVPAPSAAVWNALEEVLDPAADAAVPLFEGKGGHPVLLAPPFMARLCRRDPASPEARLDVELRSAHTRRVPVDDPRVRLNLNAPEDWGKLVKGT